MIWSRKDMRDGNKRIRFGQIPEWNLSGHVHSEPNHHENINLRTSTY